MSRWGWLLALTVLAGGCAVAPVDDEGTATGTPSSAPTSTRTLGSTPTSTGTPSLQPLAPAPAQEQLGALRVEPRPSAAEDYRREAFGYSWADIDGNGCNQRDDVLLRDAVEADVQQQDACDHDVVAGTWRDPYTGATLTFDDLKDLQQAQAIQIDHVVPLSEAWKSGARDWNDQRRLRFANTLGNLLAVDGPTNMSKGDDDPAAWRPRKDYQCAYATRWIRVKHRWRLAADPSEVDALRAMLGFC